MYQAVWNNVVIAESDKTIEVEGNKYFPEESVGKEYLMASEHTSVCPWKGTASYHHLNVNNEKNENAVWYYPEPKSKASNIKNYMAFWLVT